MRKRVRGRPYHRLRRKRARECPYRRIMRKCVRGCSRRKPDAKVFAGASVTGCMDAAPSGHSSAVWRRVPAQQPAYRRAGLAIHSEAGSHLLRTLLPAYAPPGVPDILPPANTPPDARGAPATLPSGARVTWLSHVGCPFASARRLTHCALANLSPAQPPSALPPAQWSAYCALPPSASSTAH